MPSLLPLVIKQKQVLIIQQKIEISGVTINYDGNTYQTSYQSTASVTLGCASGTTVGESLVIVNVFVSPIAYTFAAQFTTNESIDTRSIRLALIL